MEFRNRYLFLQQRAAALAQHGVIAPLLSLITTGVPAPPFAGVPGRHPYRSPVFTGAGSVACLVPAIPAITGLSARFFTGPVHP